MKWRLVHLIAAICAFTVLGCERKSASGDRLPLDSARTKTLETFRLGAAIEAYERNPTAENHAVARKALADLDGEIAELEILVAKRDGEKQEEAAVKLANLKAYRTAEAARFAAAAATAPVSARDPVDARTGAEKLEDAARRAGHSIERGARKAEDAMKDAVR